MSLPLAGLPAANKVPDRTGVNELSGSCHRLGLLSTRAVRHGTPQRRPQLSRARAGVVSLCKAQGEPTARLAVLHGQQRNKKSASCSLARKRLRRAAARSCSCRIGSQNANLCPEDEVEWVYFPSSGVISMLQLTARSRDIELATVGKEGALGAIAGFGLNRALTVSMVQMPLTAIKISGVQFRKHVSQYATLQEVAVKSNEVTWHRPKSLRRVMRFTV
jgi:hypothetical protein